MTKTTKTSVARKSIVAGLACALAIVGAVSAGAPKAAIANDGTEAAVQYAGHYEGEKVTIYPDTGGPVYAEWHMVGGRWAATFWTYNWTRVYAYPASGGGWTFWVSDGGNSVQVVRTPDEGVGPQGTASHWREAYGIARY
jgi:hypothetical protein